MQRRAVIDVGSNTVHLLVADADPHSVRAVHDSRAPSGLGAALTAGEGCIGGQRIQEVTGTVRGYTQEARRWGADEVLITGTYAVRAAVDGIDLTVAVRLATGISLLVLDEADEAAFCLAGASLDPLPDPPFLLTDIGGGSSEVILAGPDSIIALDSARIGSGAAVARWLSGDPPPPERVRTATSAVRGLIGRLRLPDEPVDEIVATGGAARRLRRQMGKQPHASHGAPVAALLPVIDALLHTPIERWPHPLKDSHRAETTRGGALILRAMLERWQPHRWRVASGGLREGLVLLRARGWTPGTPPLAPAQGTAP